MLSFLPCRPPAASVGAVQKAGGHFCFGLLLALLTFGPSAHAATAPVDSLRALLRHRALPDTQRVEVLKRLCQQYGTSALPPDSALAYGRRAVAQARRLHRPRLLLDAIDALGNVYGRAHRMPEALQSFLEQLRLAQQYRQPRYESRAYVALGTIYTEQSDLQQAEHYYRKALATAERDPVFDVLARAQGMLGSFLVETNRNPVEAEILIKKSLASSRRTGTPRDQAVSLSYLADCALLQGHYRAGIAYAREAIALLPPDNAYELSCLYDMLGRAYVGLQQLGPAAAYSTQAVAYARAARVPATEMELLDSLIRIHAQRRDFAAIYPLHKRTVALHDSVFHQNQAAEVNRLLAKFDAEKKQHAIRTLTQQNRIQQLEVDRQRIRIRLLAVGALALGLALGLFGVLYWQLSRSRRQLAASEGELRRLNHTKDLLMSIIGHDLRGPLAAFQQVAHILRVYARKPDPVALTELADEVEAGASRAGVLLDNLLHWSRAQANDVANHPEILAAAPLVAEVVGLYRPAALAKQIRLVTDLPADLPPIWADPTLLATVLRNLISNAVKFTPAGGTVTVMLEPAAVAVEQAGLTFTVADTGIGMPAHRLSTLFEAGQECSTRGTAGEPGTGLGLAVCRAFVALLGGRLRVTSTEGAGTRFAFELPLAPATPALAPPSAADRVSA